MTSPAAAPSAFDVLKPVLPHGGSLVDRELTGRAREEALKEARSLPKITLHDFEVADVEMIASGALSPLTGFMGLEDFQSVLERARLANGLVWSVPILLARPAAEAEKVRPGSAAALHSQTGDLLGLLRVKELYSHDREAHAEKVFGTGDVAHPGVERVKKQMGEVAIAGELSLLNQVPHDDFRAQRLSPRQTRALFQSRGWKTVVAFQTRNPIHRAHEYLTKVALEVVDGLLIHPLVGETKAGDISPEVRMRCYQALLENYYPPERVTLAVFPAAMRYGGPREAVFHAIARKNYGVTHFIVGRDHAGVNRPDGKPYYTTYQAQEYIGRFTREELGIDIFKFENTFFDRRTGGMVSEKTKPAGADPVSVSGTKMRDMLRAGQLPPEEVTRPEVAKILIEAARNGNI
jgi:sulfate adenylyltransferase